MGSFTYGQLQSRVISGRFKQAQATDVGDAINDAYLSVWGLEEWTFRYAQQAVTVTADSDTVSDLPAQLGPVLGLWRSNGDRLVYVPPIRFNNLTFGDTGTGIPEYFTVINGSLLVGPTSSETDSSYRLLHERRAAVLANSDDTNLLPAGRDLILVHWAREIMLAAENDPTAEFSRELKEQALDSLRRDYLEDQRGEPAQWGAYEPGGHYL